MKEYNVFWKEELIGKLYVDGDMHKYEANVAKISALKSEPMNPVLKNSRGWGDAIPYFKIRLDANERFENLEIGFQTDFMTLHKIE